MRTQLLCVYDQPTIFVKKTPERPSSHRQKHSRYGSKVIFCRKTKNSAYAYISVLMVAHYNHYATCTRAALTFEWSTLPYSDRKTTTHADLSEKRPDSFKPFCTDDSTSLYTIAICNYSKLSFLLLLLRK